jgi:hypothetical protein
VPVSPHCIEKVVLLGQLPGLAGELAQHREGLGRQGHGPARSRELSVLLIQLELIEAQRFA